ncbi:hypothetical protein Tco_0069751 [Tanacetum coccineum]
MRSVRMTMGEVVTNLPPSTPGSFPNPLSSELENRGVGWQVTSWKEMLSIGGRLKQAKRGETYVATLSWKDCNISHFRVIVRLY